MVNNSVFITLVVDNNTQVDKEESQNSVKRNV